MPDPIREATEARPRVRAALVREQAARDAYNQTGFNVLAHYAAWVAAEAEVRDARRALERVTT